MKKEGIDSCKILLAFYIFFGMIFRRFKKWGMKCR